jgi:hypothetical protein
MLTLLHQRPLQHPAAMNDATATTPPQASMPGVSTPGPEDVFLQIALRPITPPPEGLSHHDRAFASQVIETILRWRLDLREDRAVRGTPQSVRPYLCVRPVAMVRALITEAVGAAGRDNMMLYVLACIMTAFMSAVPETLRLSDVTQFFADHALWSAAKRQTAANRVDAIAMHNVYHFLSRSRSASCFFGSKPICMVVSYLGSYAYLVRLLVLAPGGKTPEPLSSLSVGQNEARVTRSTRKKAVREQCRIRDQDRCVITGMLDEEKYNELFQEDRSLVEGVFFGTVDVSHIIPFSMGYTNLNTEEDGSLPVRQPSPSHP